jgi:hypothetical protein
MQLSHQKPHWRTNQNSLVGYFAAFTIWVATLVIFLMLCWPALLVLLVAMVASPRLRSPLAPKLSTHLVSDRIAWIAFSIGVFSMLGVTLIALRSDGDGHFRSWEQIRQQVRFLFAAGMFALGVPAMVTLLQCVQKRTLTPAPAETWPSVRLLDDAPLAAPVRKPARRVIFDESNP